jgi:hypothetical protein
VQRSEARGGHESSSRHRLQFFTSFLWILGNSITNRVPVLVLYQRWQTQNVVQRKVTWFFGF